MRNSILLAALACLAVGCAHSGSRSDVAKKDVPPYCLTETGTRIPPKDGQCNNLPGRAVTRDELERTGATNTRDAIKQSVPEAH